MSRNRSRSSLPVAGRLLSPLREFLKDSRSVGITLICCTLASLILTNSTWGPSFLHFWEQELHMPAPEIHLPHTPLHIINDFLMAVFFLLVGLEIKRELMVGELAHWKQALLPGIGALGGMIVPAGIYLLWCSGSPFSRGWGIPMATDIAFSLGILSLLGKRAPVQLRIFLTALAIIDDLGGILTIAIFYASSINWLYLGMAGIVLSFLVFMNLFRVRQYYVFFMLGLLLWYFVYNSGIHATVAGVLLAFCIPLHRVEQIEHALHDPVNFVILPLFALANTAIVLPDDYGSVLHSPLHHGIFTGLLLGKPLGIALFSFIAVKLRLASLPDHVRWKQLIGAGLIAGIGFTMSIFMATLAFDGHELQLTAKIGILHASLLAGILGYLTLRLINRKQHKKTAAQSAAADN